MGDSGRAHTSQRIWRGVRIRTYSDPSVFRYRTNTIGS